MDLSVPIGRNKYYNKDDIQRRLNNLSRTMELLFENSKALNFYQQRMCLEINQLVKRSVYNDFMEKR